MVQHVEEFTSNLQAEALGDLGSLVDAKVDVISAWAIEVSAGQHIARERTEVGNTRDRIKVRAAKARTKVKVVERVCSAAGVRHSISGPAVRRRLERPWAGCECFRALEQGEREASPDRNNLGNTPPF